MASNIELLKIAGIANLVFMVLVFLSCRCMAGPKVLKWLFGNKSFMRFYSLHCYFWWGLFISLAMHTYLAISIFGLF